MSTLQVLDTKNKKVGEIPLDADMAEKVNKAVLYYAVKAVRNNMRHGDAKVKDRKEVNRTNRKIYRQKGTGGARHGARSPNLFVGGGSAHGPRPRSYFESLNKKFKTVSYHEVLKYLIQNDALKVMKELSFEKPSTKSALNVLKNMSIDQALVVLPKENTNAHLSFRNLMNVKVINEGNINVYDLLLYKNVIMTEAYFGNLKVRYSL